MKKIRNAAVFLLCILMLCCTAAAHHHSDQHHTADQRIFSDVPASAGCCTAVEALYRAGVVTGDGSGCFNPQGCVTRAEAAAIVCRLCGYGGTAKRQCATGFSDVPSTHWASGYVAKAAALGIVSGCGGGRFDPDAPVSYPQMVKMLICAAGHGDDATRAGGFPQGYISVAAGMGICRQDLPCERDCPRGDMAEMCYHTALAANGCACKGCQKICKVAG